MQRSCHYHHHHHQSRVSSLPSLRSPLSLVPLLLLAIPSSPSLLLGTSAAPVTYSGNSSSFIRYPEWTPNPERLLRFQFRTSELDGILLYTEDSASRTYLLIRLVGGSVVYELSLRQGEMERLKDGIFLNNNQPHTVTIFHSPDNNDFEYVLDDGTPLVENYAGGLTPSFGPGGVYLGNIPPDAVVLSSNGSFIGCLESVEYGSGDITWPSGADDALEQVEFENKSQDGLLDGCPDPCEGVDCGPGRCVSRWPSAAFCDCRGTNRLGETCSEDPSNHALTLTPDMEMDPEIDPEVTTHFCYEPLIQPYTGQPNSASVQLDPPIPSEGTVMVAHTQDERNFFSLRIENRRIVFEYKGTNNVTSTLSLDYELERETTGYQINVTTTSNRATVVLYQVSESGEGVELERADTGTTNTLYPETSVFSVVCFGGSLLEYRNYEGTMQQGFFGYNSLFEERNDCQLKTEAVGRSDFINFVDSTTPRSLTFNRFRLRSHTIQFEARYPPLGQSGALLIAQSDPVKYVFLLITIGDRDLQVIVLNGTSFIQGIPFGVCGSTPVADEEWHSFDIVLITDPPPGEEKGIIVTVDGTVTCTLQNAVMTRILPEMLEYSLHFGLTHSLNQFRTFTGCISNIVLRETADSELFRPNLEAVPRTTSELDTSFCFHCEGKQALCPDEHVCMDRGLGLEAECGCPQGFTGENCQDPDVNILCMPTNGTLTPEPDTTTPEPDTTTPEPDTTTPSSQMSTTTSTTGSPAAGLETAAWVGVGVAIGTLVLAVVVIVTVVCVWNRCRASKRGYYDTHEGSNGSEAPMIRYSASLRQLSSEVVSLNSSKGTPDEVSWGHKNGNSVENEYSNGGPPIMTSLKSPVTTGTKEYFL